MCDNDNKYYHRMSIFTINLIASVYFMVSILSSIAGASLSVFSVYVAYSSNHVWGWYLTTAFVFIALGGALSALGSNERLYLLRKYDWIPTRKDSYD